MFCPNNRRVPDHRLCEIQTDIDSGRVVWHVNLLQHRWPSIHFEDAGKYFFFPSRRFSGSQCREFVFRTVLTLDVD